MAVVDQQMRLTRPYHKDVYLPGLSALSPRDLLGRAPTGKFSFVHSALLQDAPVQPDPTHPTWQTWLCDALGIRDQIRLVSRQGDSLSDEFSHVATYESEKLLGTLGQLWLSEGALVNEKPALKEDIKQTLVPCQSGVRYPLSETYLPMDDMKRYCRRFVRRDESFPFLDLGSRPSQEDLDNKWSFLHNDFDVTRSADLGFLLDIVGCMVEENPGGLPMSRCRDVASLYGEIEAKCAASPTPDGAREIVR